LKFVQRFAGIAPPLQPWTENSRPFLSTKECERAFDQLKGNFISLLSSDSQMFTPETDASDRSIGAVLSQLTDEKAIALASRLRRASAVGEVGQICVLVLIIGANKPWRLVRLKATVKGMRVNLRRKQLFACVLVANYPSGCSVVLQCLCRSPRHELRYTLSNHRIGLDTVGPLSITRHGNRFIPMMIDINGARPYRYYSTLRSSIDHENQDYFLSPRGQRTSRTDEQTIKRMLSTFLDRESSDTWDEHSPQCRFAHWTAVNNSARFSHALLHFGHELRLPIFPRRGINTRRNSSRSTGKLHNSTKKLTTTDTVLWQNTILVNGRNRHSRPLPNVTARGKARTLSSSSFSPTIFFFVVTHGGPISFPQYSPRRFPPSPLARMVQITTSSSLGWKA
uniref:RT_RNaseH_2 domain-containing protein n=1 Tax=Schistocephalus solidus TaxID=70667 RepID=A0A183TGM6_SCHSO